MVNHSMKRSTRDAPQDRRAVDVEERAALQVPECRPEKASRLDKLWDRLVSLSKVVSGSNITPERQRVLLSVYLSVATFLVHVVIAWGTDALREDFRTRSKKLRVEFEVANARGRAVVIRCKERGQTSPSGIHGSHILFQQMRSRDRFKTWLLIHQVLGLAAAAATVRSMQHTATSLYDLWKTGWRKAVDVTTIISNVANTCEARVDSSKRAAERVCTFTSQTVQMMKSTPEKRILVAEHRLNTSAANVARAITRAEACMKVAKKPRRLRVR